MIEVKRNKIGGLTRIKTLDGKEFVDGPEEKMENKMAYEAKKINVIAGFLLGFMSAAYLSWAVQNRHLEPPIFNFIGAGLIFALITIIGYAPLVYIFQSKYGENGNVKKKYLGR